MLENYRQVLIQAGFPEDKVGSVPVWVGKISLPRRSSTCAVHHNCCTVVVGRHHKSKTEEFLFGSTSSKLIHEAKNCAVWVVE